ncbi:hypothetical protein IV38_GL000652 [Lactobacillus selangorensis]|nr:hypothetical protein [Lactobacillus selangorensis]KRN29763.1 hypothetical protein IV38_GL000652 [Lactobacillus selangorensis]
MVVKQQPRYVFGVLNLKTDAGYEIHFLNIPDLSAKGVTYAETLYYAYRVLSHFLEPFKEDAAQILQYTFRELPIFKKDKNSFLTLITVTHDLDPHKMEMTFLLPQTRASELADEADQVGRLIRFLPNRSTSDQA